MHIVLNNNQWIKTIYANVNITSSELLNKFSIVRLAFYDFLLTELLGPVYDYKSTTILMRQLFFICLFSENEFDPWRYLKIVYGTKGFSKTFFDGIL